MKIRTKLILNYSALTIVLLTIFSIIIVFAYIRYRQSDFLIRLRNRSISSVNVLDEQNNVNIDKLRAIDNSIVTSMKDFQISVYDSDNHRIYSNFDTLHLNYTAIRLNNTKSIKDYFSIGYKTINFSYNQSGHEYKVVASAFDTFGLNELHKLLNIIIWVFIVSVIFIIGFGFYSAIWSLKPFRNIINEVEAIDPSDLKKRLSANGNDEISQLSQIFNILLDRIEQTFEREKSFVSNASHELRTPVTSVLGQIEVGLNNTRTEEEYKTILHSVYDDTQHMVNIINGFLDLAEASLVNYRFEMNPVRIDEIIFSIIDEFQKRKPLYKISVEFATTPSNDNQMEYNANGKQLLLMFNNLVDNACKYSEDKSAKIKIDFGQNEIIVVIIDHGIGIPKDDMENIFKPLFRGSNSISKPGNGIGLAVVKRIADFHNIEIDIKSEVNIGTVVTVRMKT